MATATATAADKPITPVELPKTLEPENPNEQSTDPSATTNETTNQETAEAEEDEGECGFCLFMKGGGCRETFTNWEKCVEEGEKNDEDIVNKCFEATSALKKCMEAHTEYYGVILQAEKDAEQEVNNQLDQQKEHVADGSSSSEPKQEQKLEKE
ncbi:hypothetical protein L1987_79391 [Smallanthus sonchifolius]|uniref:Uncharacterized protein n=1 Tax=Smallanthus sonchifolius TaxID=185202 RepID=A0ACB8ZF10_9ASTR|nr:hypothetical protein L1987_79391 [Smallanthus sonchifolius]